MLRGIIFKLSQIVKEWCEFEFENLGLCMLWPQSGCVHRTFLGKGLEGKLTCIFYIIVSQYTWTQKLSHGSGCCPLHRLFMLFLRCSFLYFYPSIYHFTDMQIHTNIP